MVLQREGSRVGWYTQLNMLIFLICVYASSLTKVKEFIGEANVTLFSFSAIACSFGVLVSDICRTYKTNGWWIVCNFCVVAFFVFFLMEVTGICSPGLHLNMKISILNGGLLTMKLMFDITQRVCGITID